jgi:cytochrome c
MDGQQAGSNRLRRGLVRAAVVGISAAVVVAGISVAAGVSTDPQSRRAPAAGLYTIEQAKRGEQIYRRECTVCHQDNMTGRKSDGGPPLRGRQFTSRWGGLSIQALLTTMEELMPAKHPGSLDKQGYVDVVSFILQTNGVPSGKTELPTNRDALRKIIVKFE